MKRDARQILTELLVLKAQSGDERAFTEIYQLWSPDLRRLARAKVEREQAVDEACQDAWVSIARGIRRLDDPAVFPSWAMRILCRRCADWIRTQQRDRSRTEMAAEAELFDTPSPESARLPSLNEAIAQLDPEARQLLILFYEHGFTVSEIAATLGIPDGTVKSRLSKLRQQLRTYMERTDNE